VSDGQQAWGALENQSFDLLITDNDMPGLSGEELVKKVRLRGLDLPIIVASARLDFVHAPANRGFRITQTLHKLLGSRELTEAVQFALSETATVGDTSDWQRQSNARQVSDRGSS